MEKKVYKAIIISSVTALLLGASITTIVFSKQSYMGGIQKVTFFSQSPSYRDKGFNELTYDGANDYAMTEKKMVGNTSTTAYSDDGSSYVHEISNIYDLGADTIVSSGFNVAGSYSSEYDKDTPGSFDGLYKKGYKDKSIVIIDDDSLSKVNENAISINFKTQDAGFISGVAASLYTVYANEKFGSKPSIAVWGGLAYSTVFDWLSGFEQGINWFNYQILGFKLDGSEVEKKASDWNDLKKNHKKSLKLAGKSINDHPILDEKITINNAGDITVDYTASPPEGSNDGVNVDPGTSFYTGGFGFDPNDQASGSNAAVKIKKINSNNDAIVFPVAGGQTMETLANLKQDSKTMAIGVDSDAETANPNYGGNILGSATKNIERAANFGTWYSQHNPEDADFDKEAEEYADDSGMTAKEFVNKWTIKDDSIIGSQFQGTFDNEGVGFSDNDSNKIGRILEYYGLKDITTEIFVNDIMPEIFDMNGGIIESSSETFAIQGPYTPEHLTVDMSKDYPWIPNWTEYKN